MPIEVNGSNSAASTEMRSPSGSASAPFKKNLFKCFAIVKSSLKLREFANNGFSFPLIENLNFI